MFCSWLQNPLRWEHGAELGQIQDVLNRFSVSILHGVAALRATYVRNLKTICTLPIWAVSWSLLLSLSARPHPMSQRSESGLMPGRTRRGGRAALRKQRAKRSTNMLPALKRQLPLVEPMSQEQVEKIDDASMSILEEVGVIFRDHQAIADWRTAGATIKDGDRVHLDRGLIRELIQTIPSSFTFHARNPANNLPFGNDHAIFVPSLMTPPLVTPPLVTLPKTKKILQSIRSLNQHELTLILRCPFICLTGCR